VLGIGFQVLENWSRGVLEKVGELQAFGGLSCTAIHDKLFSEKTAASLDRILRCP
jgi:hypothetical protein